MKWMNINVQSIDFVIPLRDNKISLSITMLIRIKITILCLVAGWLTPQLIVAETLSLQRSDAVTLSSLVQKVYEPHPSRQNELAYQQKVEANTDLANALFADASQVLLIYNDDVVGSGDGFREFDGGVVMPFWLSGQKQQQQALSEKIAAEVPAYQQQLKLQISATIRDLVWNIITAETAEIQAKKTWETAQRLEQDVAARVKAGDLAGSELLLASTNALEMNSHYIEAQGELGNALTIYQQFTEETALPQQVEEILSSKTNIDAQHPSLALYDQQINTLRAEQGLAHYEDAVNTTFYVGVKSSRDDNHSSFNNSLGLGITFALDDDVYRQPAVADAGIDLTNAEVARQNLARQLRIVLSSEIYDLEVKKQQLELAIEHDKTTQQYVLLQQRAFDLGEIDLVALLLSQKLANESRSRKQLLEVSIKHMTAKVNQAVGIVL